MSWKIELYATHKIKIQSFDLNPAYGHPIATHSPYADEDDKLLLLLACQQFPAFGEAVVVLLETGANPNALDRAGSSTPWEIFLNRAYRTRTLDAQPLDPLWSELARLFICHGATSTPWRSSLGPVSARPNYLQSQKIQLEACVSVIGFLFLRTEGRDLIAPFERPSTPLRRLKRAIMKKLIK